MKQIFFLRRSVLTTESDNFLKGSGFYQSFNPLRLGLMLVMAFVIVLKSSDAQKIYVITDLEGASGVYKWGQVDHKDDRLNLEACEFFMSDLSALVRGLRDGGATEVFVFDGHGLQSILPNLLVPGAKYLTGHPRPSGLLGIDSSFAGVVLLGFHAMKGTEDGVLNHTQNSKSEARYWYNGVESGEIAQDGAKCGFFGVPPIMVTGDVATCREATKFFGKNCVTVAVKEGISQESAILYSLDDTRKAIYEGAKKAIAAIPTCKPYVLKTPIKAKMTYYDHDASNIDARLPKPNLITKEWIINDEPNFLEY